MEEVAVIAPPVVHNDDLTDDSIILNLQVSDAEEIDNVIINKPIVEEKAVNGKILLAETEEDILNKYVADSPSIDEKIEDDVLVNNALAEASAIKCNGLGGEGHEDTENSVDENAKEEIVKLKGDASAETPDVTKQSNENDSEPEVSSKAASEADESEPQIDPIVHKGDGLCNGLPVSEASAVDKDVCRIESKKENEESEANGNKPSVKDPEESSNAIPTSNKDGEEKTDDVEDGEDLLQVMEEKSIEEAEQENKDENSCSSSDKEEEHKVPAIDETGDDNNESQVDADEAGECPMDIEENDIGIIFSEHNTSKELDATQNPDKIALRRGNSSNMDIGESVISNEKESVDEENIDDPAMNKENEKPVDVKVDSSIAEDTASTEALTNGDDVEMHEEKKVEPVTPPPEDFPKKSNKRQLSPADDTDDAKKIKLDGVPKTEIEPETPPVEKRELIKLNSFKQFMLDKQLEKLTRYELEELCLQKMCECIVNKSEIGDLRQKVKVQEQAIDTWRKEAVVVAKQTRDLKIVHERLVADLKAMKEQAGKPLVPVKITRSVGLQAYIENTFRQRNQSVVNGVNSRASPATPAKAATTGRQQVKTKATPQRTTNKPLQPVQKENVNTPKHRAIQPAKKNADPKAVIDLTDEDEKNQTAKPNTTQSVAPTFRVINKSNNSNNNNKVTNVVTSSSPQKIMIMSPNVLGRPGSAVMLKVNSNGVVSQPNGVITSMANGQVQSQATVRTVQARVSSVPTPVIRPVTTVKPSFKHPAPLPPAPSSQLTIAARKPIPPRPHLNLTRSNCGTGIVLQWKMPYKLEVYENIVSYQLYAYQETKSPPRTDNWGKIGDVKALELPMAVTLTQFAVGNRYFFAVRAVDALKRLGPFSEPQTILL